MGNKCSQLKCYGRNRREEPSQQGTELEHLPPARPPRGRTGGTQGGSRLPSISPYPPEQQTQTLGQESNPREVAGADFNNYMRVDDIRIGDKLEIKESHEVGHNFLVEFIVTNTTSNYLHFTEPPTVVWGETIRTTEGVEGQTERQRDQYKEKPNAQTFLGWRMGWKEIIKPNETKKIMIQDVPRLINLNQDENGRPRKRTASRSVEFDVSVPGNGPRWRATQNVEVVNGEVQDLTLQVH